MFAWLKSLMSGEEGYAVVFARLPDGISAELGFALRDLFNDNDPEGWWFINPGSFLAIFALAKDGRERAAKLIAAVEALKATEPELSDIRIGRSEGPLLDVDVRADGKIATLPHGETLNNASLATHKSHAEA